MIKKEFAEQYNGQDLYTYTLEGKIQVEVSTLGATLLSLRVPDKNGDLVDVMLNHLKAEERGSGCGYMGAVVGRIGNRIGDGRFTLEGKTYQLALNDGGKAHLHGGVRGFDQKNYEAVEQGDSLLLTCCSPDGDEGYPAGLTLKVKYTVRETSLIIEYFAESDGTTILSPTNHAYFNLNGESDGSILDNVLQLRADRYLPTDENLIPTGEERPVAGTAFDFRQPKPIGADIGAQDDQLATAGGYDHNFCLTDPHFAVVYSEKTGIQMDCYTDRPGVQFYSGNFLEGKVGKSQYNKNAGFCLETQLYPDSIHKPQWQSPVLRKGETFYSKTEYRFSIKG